MSQPVSLGAFCVGPQESQVLSQSKEAGRFSPRNSDSGMWAYHLPPDFPGHHCSMPGPGTPELLALGVATASTLPPTRF